MQGAPRSSQKVYQLSDALSRRHCWPLTRTYALVISGRKAREFAFDQGVCAGRLNDGHLLLWKE